MLFFSEYTYLRPKLQRRRYAHRLLDQPVIQKRHPGLDAPRHRHVVHALDRVIYYQLRYVRAQHRVMNVSAPSSCSDASIIGEVTSGHVQPSATVRRYSSWSRSK